MWGRTQGEEGAVLAQEEFFGLGKCVVLAALGIVGQAGAVRLVGGERGDVVCGGGGALMEGVVLELRLFGRVDLVEGDAGEHGVPFCCDALFWRIALRECFVCGRSMKEGSDIARIAALVGDPARAHLAKLEAGGRTYMHKSGRRKYVSLAGPEMAHVLEALMGLAAGQGHLRTRAGPKDGAQHSQTGGVQAVVTWKG